MSLHVVIGFADKKQKSSPHAVYCGPSGAEARAAMAASTAESFLVLNNPFGLRKNNPNAAANRLLQAPAPAASPAPVDGAPFDEALVSEAPAPVDEASAPVETAPAPAADEAAPSPGRRRRV